MLYSLDEHEMRIEGINKPQFELGRKLAPLELEAQCIDFEKKIAEDCLYLPEFSYKIDELCKNYTTNDLLRAHSLYATDLFSVRNELLQFMSVNSSFEGEIPDNLRNEFERLQKKLSDAIIYDKMLKIAIEIKQQDAAPQQEDI